MGHNRGMCPECSASEIDEVVRVLTHWAAHTFSTGAAMRMVFLMVVGMAWVSHFNAEGRTMNAERRDVQHSAFIVCFSTPPTSA